MARKDFDTADYRGGALTVPDKPKRLRYACYADQCPMPGTIFTAGTDKPGVCAWHYGVQGVDVPRVTQILLDWRCVSFEVEEARRTLTDPDIAASPKHIAERFATAWERLAPLTPGWHEQLQPSTVKHHRNGQTIDTGFAEDYGQWARRLEAFLGGQVVEALGVRGPRRAAAPAHARTFAEGETA